MASNLELESIIEDSISDAVTPEPVEDSITTEASPSEPTLDTAPEVTEASPDKTITDSPIKAESNEVTSPGASNASKEDEDEFAKKHGLPTQLPGGRENRIPYTRVKKIAANAANEAVFTAQKKWQEEQAPILAKVTEYEGKVKDYETRLTQVGQFEQVMTTQPREFLQMLSQIPAYSEFFDLVNRAATAMQAQPAAGAPAAGATDGMPQPNFPLPDGTKIYDEEGLQKLQDWQASRIEAKLSSTYDQRLKTQLAEVEKTYAPIKQRYDQEQYVASLIPKIQSDIDTARKWPQFNENEEDIVKALNADRNLSLEGAYRQVVFPKIQADRDTMRASILAEIQKQPTSTSPQARANTRPQAAPVAQGNGPVNLEDLIASKVREAGL